MQTENHNQSKLSLDEIVFENRNRAYGAFAIRRDYDRNVITGFFFSAGFVLSIVTAMYLTGNSYVPSIADINKKLAEKHEFKILEIELPDKPEAPKSSEKNVIPPAGSDKLNKQNTTPTPTVTPIIQPEKKEIKNDSAEYNPNGKGGPGPVLPIGGGDGKGKDPEGGGNGKKPEAVDVAEVMPEFPGGEEALFGFFSKNLHFPVYERENGITGVVFVSFVVNSNGAIDQIEILRSPSIGFNDEVIRVVKKMPIWKAGIQGGQKVPVRFKMPVRFSLKK